MLMEMEQEGVSVCHEHSVSARQSRDGRKKMALLSPTHYSILVSLVGQRLLFRVAVSVLFFCLVLTTRMSFPFELPVPEGRN